MSATTPKSLTTPGLPFNSAQFGHLAINTNTKRHYSSINPHPSKGSSGLPPKKIKSPNQVALLTSPPLNKRSSYVDSSNSASVVLPKSICAISEKSSSGLFGPSSSSSQPSKKFFDYRSPRFHKNFYSGEVLEIFELEEEKNEFSEEFYYRIEQFLDYEGLNLIDVADFVRGDRRIVRKFRMIRARQSDDIAEETLDFVDQFPSDIVRSAYHSPKLVLSGNIGCSKLFQRRVSYSQAPVKGLSLCGGDSPVNKSRLSRLDSKMRSPIMEDTPRSYRTSTLMSLKSSALNTPISVRAMHLQGALRQSKARAASRDCSSELSDQIKAIPQLKGAQSVHGKVRHGNFMFKNQNEL